MRTWTVAGAVIVAGVVNDRPVDVADDAVLLVENLRRNGTSDWTTPGGVVDTGEQPLEGLTREVREETGLRVGGWGGLLYEIRAQAPDLGWDLRVEVHRAIEVTGELTIGSDPDGIVIGSAWTGPVDGVDLLRDAHLWVREPLGDWLAERWVEPRTYRYRVLGATPDDLRVERA